jgi:hypothetical protein
MSENDLKMRGIEVILDDVFVGDIAYGRSLKLPISPGSHTLKVTNRLKSRKIEFQAAPGETVRFEATGVLMGGIWIFMSMLGTFAYRVTLERAK